jgi:hypothetical protein
VRGPKIISLEMVRGKMFPIDVGADTKSCLIGWEHCNELVDPMECRAFGNMDGDQVAFAPSSWLCWMIVNVRFVFD